MDKLLNQVYCKSHGKNYLELEQQTFQIKCMNCVKEKTGNGTENLELRKTQVEEKEEIFCYKHKTEEGIFYCEDCREFLCKTCFPLEHRSHSCSTPELIVPSIKSNLTFIMKDLINLKKTVEENMNEITELNNFFVNTKSDFQKNLNDINSRFNTSLRVKTNEFNAQIENIFKGVDSEVDNSTQRLEVNKKKATKILGEIQRFNREIESLKSEKKICQFKKENEGVLLEHEKFFADIENFLNNQLDKTKKKTEQEMSNFESKCKEFQKNAQNYETSVVNTILSGIPNICMRIRRFKKYYFQSTRYFKVSTVMMKTSSTINLAGYGLCGLFFNKTNTKEIDFELSIYETDSQTNYENSMVLLDKIKIRTPIISNIIDPTFQFYLKSAITINKDKFYIIKIANVSEHPYIDIWTGEARDTKKEKTEEDNDTVHSVICNNSNVKFTFRTSIGMESDFNEIVGGLLSDVIFSHFE